MSANIELIQRKKRLYGNNFSELSIAWSQHLTVTVSERDVAKMMTFLKLSRLDNLIKEREKIESALKRGVNLSAKNRLESDLHDIENAIEDTMQDKEAYEWITYNYEQYLNL